MVPPWSGLKLGCWEDFRAGFSMTAVCQSIPVPTLLSLPAASPPDPVSFFPFLVSTSSRPREALLLFCPELGATGRSVGSSSAPFLLSTPFYFTGSHLWPYLETLLLNWSPQALEYGPTAGGRRLSAALILGLSQSSLVEPLPERLFCFVANGGRPLQAGGCWILEPPKHLSGDEFSSSFPYTLAKGCQGTGQGYTPVSGRAT